MAQKLLLWFLQNTDETGLETVKAAFGHQTENLVFTVFLWLRFLGIAHSGEMFIYFGDYMGRHRRALNSQPEGPNRGYQTFSDTFV